MTNCNYCEESDVYDILNALADKETVCNNCLILVLPNFIKNIDTTLNADNSIVDIEDLEELAHMFLGFVKNCEGRLSNE